MATRRWRPTAAKVTQVDTVTFENADWAEGSTITGSVGAASMTVTLGATDATDNNAAAAFSEALNATAAGAVGNDSTVDVGGQTIPEFKEFTAAVNANVVTITGDEAGVPFGARNTGGYEYGFETSVSHPGAETGAATAATVTEATGPWHFDNAANWIPSGVPVEDDNLLFRDSNVPLKYGLATGLHLDQIIVDMSFTATIGLPPVNQETTGGRSAATDQYDEYRTESLTTVDSGTGVAGPDVIVGRGAGDGSPMVNIVRGEDSVELLVYDTGTPQPPSGTNNIGYTQHALRVTLDANADASIEQGSVFLGHDASGGADILTLSVGRQGAADALTNVTVGADVFGGGGYIATGATVYSGTLNAYALAPTGANFTLYGGVANIWGTATNIGSVDPFAGTVNLKAPQTILDMEVGPAGVVNIQAGAQGSTTVSNASVAAGGTINDPGRRAVWTDGIHLLNCSPVQVTLNIGSDFQLDVTDH